MTYHNIQKHIDISNMTDEQCNDLFKKSKKLSLKPYAVQYQKYGNKFIFMRYNEIVKRNNQLCDCYLFDEILDRLNISENQRKVLWK